MKNSLQKRTIEYQEPRGPKDKFLKDQNRKFLKSIPNQKRKFEEDSKWEELERAIHSTKNSKAPRFPMK